MTQAEQFLSDIEHQEWQDDRKLFALLDCAQLSNEDRRSVQGLDSSRSIGLFKGTSEEGLNEVEPFLLDPLNIPASHGISWLVQIEKTNPSVLWVASALTMNELVPHLRALLSADLPGAPNALLRFYDPRVFHKLMQVLDVDQKSLFFTNADQWWAWHKPSGNRQTYVAPTGTMQTVEKIALSALQMQALNQMDLDDFVENTKADMVRNKKDRLHTKDLSDADVKRYVGEHIDKAIAFGFESEEAVVEYLQHVAATLGWAYEKDNSGGVLSTLQDESLTEDGKLAFLKGGCATTLI